MEHVVEFSGSPPSWPTIQERLKSAGITAAIRMIDGLPAFPDEVPEEGWRELRISTPSGMMTLRLQPGRLAVVVWGNADENLQKEWDAVVQACSEKTA